MVDKLNPQDNLYMIQARAKGAVDEAASASNNGRDAMEAIQNSVGSVLGALGGILKGIFTKGGAKGGGGGGGKGG